jgi:hypothetical protein
MKVKFVMTAPFFSDVPNKIGDKLEKFGVQRIVESG